MTKVLLLNGPPGSGKDILASFINVQYNSPTSPFEREYIIVKEKFAKPLKEANAVLYGFSVEDLYNPDSDLYKWENDLKEKETPREELGGKSWRQVNIDLSELYIKKVAGKDFFGHSFVRRTLGWPEDTIFVVSDSGFTAEAEPIVKKFGPDNVLVIKIIADGKDFSNDSREYIDTDALGIRCVELYNNYDMAFFQEGYRIFEEFIGSTNG